MNQDQGLAAIFLDAVGRDGAGAVDKAGLDATLATLWLTARAAWPGIEMPAAAFVGHLARHLSAADDRVDLGPALAAVCAADLYLACACSAGLPAALSAFDAVHLSQVPTYLLRIDRSPAFTDEVRQRVRQRLLLPEGDAPPKIAEYSGRGHLSNWVRTVSVRVALSLRRSEGRHPLGGDEDIAEQAIVGRADPELDYIKQRYQGEFKAAFAEVLGALSSEQRNLLRLHFVEGLGVEKLALMFQVVPSTISRRLAGMRQELGKKTRDLLRARLRLDSGEFASLARLVRSQINLSITAALK